MPTQSTKYNQDWSKVYSFISASKKGEYYFFCSICNLDLSCAHGGKSDINDHIDAEKHKKNANDVKKMKKITDFPKAGVDNYRVVCSELAFAYHTVKYQLSFLSTDCTAKLHSTLFPDSEIAGKFACSRTKCETLVKNVLAPLSVKVLLDKIANSYFSVTIDASTFQGNKVTAILIKYFDFKEGHQVALLDISDLKNNNAVSTHEYLTSTFEKYKLSWNNVCSFSADNASVNFGITGKRERAITFLLC